MLAVSVHASGFIYLYLDLTVQTINSISSVSSSTLVAVAVDENLIVASTEYSVRYCTYILYGIVVPWYLIYSAVTLVL